MKARYKVHSVGPAVKLVEVDLPGGVKGNAEAKFTVTELLPVTPDDGSVKLAFFTPPPFAVGDTVEATFEKVG